MPKSSTRKNYMLNTTVGRAILFDNLPKGMPFINGLVEEEGSRSARQLHLPAFRRRDDGDDARSHQGTWFPVCDPRRHHDQYRRSDRASGQARRCRERPERSREGRPAVSRRRHHQRRALQQGHRHLVGRDGKDLRHDVQRNGDRPRRPVTVSTRSCSWRIPALADRSSRSASLPECAD